MRRRTFSCMREGVEFTQAIPIPRGGRGRGREREREEEGTRGRAREWEGERERACAHVYVSACVCLCAGVCVWGGGGGHNHHHCAQCHTLTQGHRRLGLPTHLATRLGGSITAPRYALHDKSAARALEPASMEAP
jgi:hypothetical protein